MENRCVRRIAMEMGARWSPCTNWDQTNLVPASRRSVGWREQRLLGLLHAEAADDGSSLGRAEVVGQRARPVFARRRCLIRWLYDRVVVAKEVVALEND